MPGKRKVDPYDSFLFEEEVDSGPDLSEKLEDIEAQFKSVQVQPHIVITENKFFFFWGGGGVNDIRVVLSEAKKISLLLHDVILV